MTQSHYPPTTSQLLYSSCHHFKVVFISGCHEQTAFGVPYLVPGSFRSILSSSEMVAFPPPEPAQSQPSHHLLQPTTNPKNDFGPERGLTPAVNLRTSGLDHGHLGRRLTGFVVRTRFCLAVYVNREVSGLEPRPHEDGSHFAR